MSWILNMKYDGAEYTVTNTYTVQGRVRITMMASNNPFTHPYLFPSKEEAEKTLRQWQKDFPADASDWTGQATEEVYE